CSGDDLLFADRTFDKAVGRLSAMFFVDPEKAIREALKVILDDGYVSFVVWGPKEANPFFATVTDVIRPVCRSASARHRWAISIPRRRAGSTCLGLEERNREACESTPAEF